MTVETKKIIEFCQEYLNISKWQDIGTNGLQLEGALKVGKIVSGVSLSRDLINMAIKKRAKMILVHHGLFDKYFPAPFEISGYRKERIKLLLSSNINLVGFHLPLDAHPVIGNNICLLKLLKLKKLDIIVSPHFGEIGYLGELKEKMSFDNFIKLVNESLNTQSCCIDTGIKQIKTVGIISGSAAGEAELVKQYGADVFLTGEIKESVVRTSEEIQLNIVAAGHYNTEKLGVQNLGNLIAEKFKIKHEFVDIPCDV